MVTSMVTWFTRESDGDIDGDIDGDTKTVNIKPE